MMMMMMMMMMVMIALIDDYGNNGNTHNHSMVNGDSNNNMLDGNNFAISIRRSKNILITLSIAVRCHSLYRNPLSPLVPRWIHPDSRQRLLAPRIQGTHPRPIFTNPKMGSLDLSPQESRRSPPQHGSVRLQPRQSERGGVGRGLMAVRPKGALVCNYGMCLSVGRKTWNTKIDIDTHTHVDATVGIGVDIDMQKRDAAGGSSRIHRQLQYSTIMLSSYSPSSFSRYKCRY